MPTNQDLPIRKLKTEMKRMHQAFQEGHIFMLLPNKYSVDAWEEYMSDMGIQFPAIAKDEKHNYLEILKKLRDEKRGK